MSLKNLKDKNIIFGICGGISAYKVPHLVRLLHKEGANVTCIVTENGAKFVTPLTLRTLSENKVYSDMFNDQIGDIEHIALSKKANVIVVVPATADVIARLSAGRAEDLLSSTILASKSPIILCPAMNENMWTHLATKANVSRLKEYGYSFVSPQKGELACGDSGIGRLADFQCILEEIKKFC